MVEQQANALDNIFSALSDPTRRAILAQLQTGEHTVSEIADPYDMSLPAISKHIRILEKAGLVHRRKDGRIHYLSLVASPMLTAQQWLEAYRVFWDDSLNALADLVEDDGDPA